MQDELKLSEAAGRPNRNKKTETSINIYSNKGELILEYTIRNCDSLSLKTLDDIYFTAKEFYNKIPSEEKPNSKIKQIKLEGLYVER